MKRMTKRFFVLLSCVLLFAGGAEAGNFSELQALINNAAVGAKVVLSDDYVYDPAADTALTTDGIIIKKAITVDGGGHAVRASGGTRCFYIKNVTTSGDKAAFKNMTITEGGGAQIKSGGGVYIDEGNFVSFDNCRIEKNGTVNGKHTEEGGAALFIESKSYVTFNNCTIAGNMGSDRSGGIYLKGNAVLTSCDIRDNRSGSRGGGIYVDPGKGDKRGGDWGGNVKMIGCTISGHKGGRGGGAYINPENDKENYFENCTFTNNDVTANSLGYGGGILFYCADAKMINCKIIDNKANRGGGIILDVASNVELENCTVTGNEATVDGSGLYAFDGSHDDNVMKTIGEATFKNCTIKDNYVTSGDVKNAQDISINYTDEATAEKRRDVNKGNFPPDGMITEESDPDEYPFWTHELWTARYDGRFTSNGGNTIGKVFRNNNISLAATDKVEAVEPPYSGGSSGCSAASFPLLLLAFGGAAVFFRKR